MINDIQRSFSLEMQSGRTVVSFRNILMGLGAAIVLAVGIGAYVLTSDKPDPLAEARRQDEMIRRNVQSQNPLPDEAIVKAMLEQHKEMVYVPGGTFVRGRYGSEAPDVATSSEPLRDVVKVPDFFIDRYEFPNKVNAKPAVRVTWAQADDACLQVGKRLCSSDEWEKACKGPGNLIYAYGDEFSEACGAEVVGSYKLGDRSECVSGYGVYDLSSGLREWSETPKPGKDGRMLVKGNQHNPIRGTRCAFAVDESSGFSETTLGFRCCLNADGSATPEPEQPAPEDQPAAE